MKIFILIFFIFQTTNCFGQQFKLKYFNINFGSNIVFKGAEKECEVGFKLDIIDTTIYYSDCEWTDEYYILKKMKDSIPIKKRFYYSKSFRKTSIDSIVMLLDTLKGKYVFKSNPYVMGGGADNIIIENENWCCYFQLKNTTDKTVCEIMKILNLYLEEKYQFQVVEKCEYDENMKPLINSCPNTNVNSRMDILETEYDFIMNN